MKHGSILGAILCVMIMLECSMVTAFANEDENTTTAKKAPIADNGIMKSAITMEGTSTIVVTLESGAIQQEVPVTSADSGTNMPDVTNQYAVRNLRRIQVLLETGDEPTLALTAMLALTSGMLACSLWLGRDSALTHSDRKDQSICGRCRIQIEDNNHAR